MTRPNDPQSPTPAATLADELLTGEILNSQRVHLGDCRCVVCRASRMILSQSREIERLRVTGQHFSDRLSASEKAIERKEAALRLALEELERGKRMLGSAPPSIEAAIEACRAALERSAQ